MSSENISSLEIIKGYMKNKKPVYHAIIKSADSGFHRKNGKPIMRTWVSLPMSETRIKAYLMRLLNEYESGMILSSNKDYINPIPKAFELREKLENPHLLPDNINTLEDIGNAAYEKAISLGGSNSSVIKAWKDGQLENNVLPDNDQDFIFQAQRWDFIVDMLPELEKKGLHQVHPSDLVKHGALKNDLGILAAGALMSDNPVRLLAETEVSISEDGFPYSDSGQIYPALMTKAGRELLMIHLEKSSDNDLKLASFELILPLYLLGKIRRDIPYENFVRTIIDNMTDISQKAYEVLKDSEHVNILANFDTVARIYKQAQEQLNQGQLVLSESERIALSDKIKESIQKDYPNATSYTTHHLTSAIQEAFTDEPLGMHVSLLEKPMMEIALKRIHKDALSPSTSQRDVIRVYTNALRLSVVRHLIAEEDYQSALKSLKNYRDMVPEGEKRALIESGIEVAESDFSIKNELETPLKANEEDMKNSANYYSVKENATNKLELEYVEVLPVFYDQTNDKKHTPAFLIIDEKGMRIIDENNQVLQDDEQQVSQYLQGDINQIYETIECFNNLEENEKFEMLPEAVQEEWHTHMSEYEGDFTARIPKNEKENFVEQVLEAANSQDHDKDMHVSFNM